MLPEAGTYLGELNGRMLINESEAGALFVIIPCKLVNSEVAWSGIHYFLLGKKDETLLPKPVAALRKIFPEWDGKDPFFLEDREPDATQFDLVCIHDEYTPESSPDGQPVIIFKVKWLNPVGGSSRMPEPVTDRKALIAKWGSKFRAVSATAGVATKAPAAKAAAVAAPAQAELPATPEAPATLVATQHTAQKKGASAPPAKKAAAPPAKTKPAGGQPPTATMEEAWVLLTQVRADLAEAELGEFFYAEIEREFPGKQPPDLSIQNWGALKVQWETLK